MSMFLPEGLKTPQASSGVADVTPPDPDTTSADIALMQRVLSAASRNPNLIPPDFMSYLFDYIQTQRLEVPIGQVFGFTGYTAQTAARVNAQETAPTTSYGDLTTVGPSLNGLADGQYLLLFGCNFTCNGIAGYMSIQPNSTPAADADAAGFLATSATQDNGLSAVTKVLRNGGSNSVTAKYRAGSSGVATFSSRWLVAIKFAN